MKHLRWLLVAVLVVSSASFSRAQTSGAVESAWISNVWVGYTHARDRAVPMVVAIADVDGCNPCAMLSRDVKNAPDILALRRSVELIWLNPAIDDEHKNMVKLLSSLGIDGYPTTVVLDVAVENGVVQALVERGRVTGYFPRDEFVGRLKAILSAPPGKAKPQTTTPAFENAPRPGAQQLPRTTAGGMRTASGQVVPRPKM